MKKVTLITGLMFLLIPFFGNSQCTTTNATSCVCETPGATNCDLLPDIIVGEPPLLVSGNNGVIEYSQSGNGANDGRLRVSVSSPNIGHGPLEIRTTNTYICGTDTITGTAPSVCPNTGLPPKQLIIQRVYQKSGNTMNSYDRDAGSMTYHPSHGHMHVDDWGIYTLRTMSTDPDPLNWPIIGTGAKLAFCLMDYGSCSTYNGHCVDSLGNTLTNGSFPNYGLGGGSYSCSQSVQGISSGYTDIYYQYLDGMYLDIPPGTCNGDYYIVVQLDPYDYFLEENENNNVLVVPYTLTQQVLTANSTITASSSGPICSNGNVTLSANSGSGYTYEWSTGATSQSINVSAPGNYVVTITTGCGAVTSAPYNVTVLDAPPLTTGDAVCDQGSVDLTANAGSGTIDWFDVPTGGASLHTGNIFTTPVVNTTTMYYAEATTTAPGFNAYAQPNTNNIGGGSFFTGSQYLIFDALQNFTLTSVKVYSQIATSTTVQLKNSSGTILNSMAANIPAGESRITLNWNISADTDYQLTRSGSAALFRNNSGVSYPYTIPGYLSITNSSAGTGFYYFFYDWEIDVSAQVCVSNRVPATATVNTSPSVTLSPFTNVCNNASTFTLIGGSPTGGVYSGNGVSGNNFNPAIAGIGTHSITYDYIDSNGCSGSANENIIVDNCSCLPPDKPSTLSGTQTICQQTPELYSIAAVPGATSYTWTVPSGITIISGQGTTAIIVESDGSFVSGAICVKAVNACGESADRCRNISKLKSKTPQSLVGDLYGHCESVVTLSVPVVVGAVSYDWTVPSGCIIISGQGTNVITFSTPAGFISGKVCVTANNGCADSNPRCKSIFGAPQRPNMGGPNFACAGQTNMYFVNPVPSATSYDWTVPAGTVILNGQGTTMINVMHGTKTGRIRCYANNACGNRSAAQIKVDILCRTAGSDNVKFTELELNVIPNPASEKATVSLIGFIDSKTDIRITNILGKEVYLKTINYVQGSNIDLNLDLLSKGIYFVTVNNSEQSKSTKLIVE